VRIPHGPAAVIGLCHRKVVLFVNMVKHREGRRAVSSRRATAAYPMWYAAKSGTPTRRRYGTRMPPYLRIGPLKTTVCLRRTGRCDDLPPTGCWRRP